jgi:hypothetical protein
MSEWIKWDGDFDRVPRHKRVLIRMDTGVYAFAIIRKNGKFKCVDSEGFWEEHFVTHWMEIPEINNE